jgi:hypothetical protein
MSKHIAISPTEAADRLAASIRYLDTFVKQDGDWLFAERLLYVDRTEERAIS